MVIQLARRSRRQRRQDIRSARLRVERLEERALLTAGSLDPTFGLDGRVVSGLVGTGFANAEAAAVQADGKVVAAGWTGGSYYGSELAIARYNPDGSLDQGFGHEGRAVLPIFVPGTTIGAQSQINGVAIQPDGRIVAVGTLSNYGAPAGVVVARFNADGSPDASFGTSGVVTDDVLGNETSAAAAVALQPNGDILVAGTVNTISVSPTGADFLLMRFLPNGTLDPTFGTGGQGFAVSDYSGRNDVGLGLALAPGGSIVVVGQSSNLASGVGDVAVARYTSKGVLDTHFGTGGEVLTDLSATTPGASNNAAYSVAIQADGKLVVAATGSLVTPTSSGYALVRYTTTGALDTSFGTRGIVTVADPDAGYSDPGGGYIAGGYDPSNPPFELVSMVPVNVVIQPSGRIIMAASSQVYASAFCAWGFRSTGAPSTGFGTKGVVAVQAPAGESPYTSALAMDGDGGLVLAGYVSSSIPQPPGVTQAFGLVRLSSSGKVVAGFGTGGVVTTPFPGTADELVAGVVTQPDGKIIVAGTLNAGTDSLRDFMLVRYNTDGSRDMSFGQGGLVITNFATDSNGVGSDDQAAAIALQPDGKILVGGTTSSGGLSGVGFALARYNPNGSLDKTFGVQHTGLVFDPAAGTTLDAIALGPCGTIIVAGAANAAGGGTEFAVLRYLSNGQHDPSWNGGNVTLTSFSSGGQDTASSVTVAWDGRVVAAGSSSTFTSGGVFAVARYLPNGSLDPSFGTGGKVTTNVSALVGGGNGPDSASGVAVLWTGQILVAGTAYPYGYGDFAVARYNANGSLDRSFGTGGLVTTDLGGDELARSLVVTGCTFVVVGQTTDTSGAYPAPYQYALARYQLWNGSLDPTFGTGGLVTTAFPEGFSGAVGVAVEPDGMLVVAGSVNDPAGVRNDDFALARYTVFSWPWCLAAPAASTLAPASTIAAVDAAMDTIAVPTAVSATSSDPAAAVVVTPSVTVLLDPTKPAAAGASLVDS